eukprot:gene33359-29435_t
MREFCDTIKDRGEAWLRGEKWQDTKWEVPNSFAALPDKLPEALPGAEHWFRVEDLWTTKVYNKKGLDENKGKYDKDGKPEIPY